MLYDSYLENVVLHSEISRECDSLFIISGYVGASMVEEILKHEFQELKKITVIQGMYGAEGIPESIHNKLLEYQNCSNNIEIRYSTIPVHSKLYCWEKEGEIKQILIGSANFTPSGMKSEHRETLCPICDESYNDYLEYRKLVFDNSIECYRATITKRAKIKIPHFSKYSQPRKKENICRMSLLDRYGKVSKKATLNWGFANGNTNFGDMYLPIRRAYIREFPDLFPPKKYHREEAQLNERGNTIRTNDPIELIWDDGRVMIGLMEGNNDVDGILYPNKICSAETKRELGDYIKSRLKSKLPVELHKQIDNKIITKKILKLYGRYSIDIRKIGESQYELDFSV